MSSSISAGLQSVISPELVVAARAITEVLPSVCERIICYGCFHGTNIVLHSVSLIVHTYYNLFCSMHFTGNSNDNLQIAIC